MAKKKSGLGKAGEELDLAKPMGEALSREVEPPPPPPPSQDSLRPEAATVSFEEPQAGGPDGEGGEGDAPTERGSAPPSAGPGRGGREADERKEPAKRPIDPQLFPWIVKKSIALETQRDDLDFLVVFRVEGKRDRLVLEGHRNCFGQLAVMGPDQKEGERTAWSHSEFASLPADETLERYRDHFTGVVVRSAEFEVFFDNFEDLLEWCEY